MTKRHLENTLRIGRYPYDPVFVEYLDAAKKISDGAKHNQDKIETRVERTFSSGFSGGYTKQPLIFAGESKNEILIEDLLNYLVNFWELQSQRGWP